MTIVLNFVIGQPSNARPVSQTTTTTPLTTTLRTTPGKTTAAANPQSCKSDQNSPPSCVQSITADITDNLPSLEHNFKRIAVKIIMLLRSIHYQSNVYTFLLCISLSVCTSWVFVLSSLCMYMYICNLNFQFSNSVHISGQQQITSDSHCTCLADAKVLYVR